MRHLVERPDPVVDDWLERSGRVPSRCYSLFLRRVNKEWGADDLLALRGTSRGRGIQPVLRWGPGEESRADALLTLSKKIFSSSSSLSPSKSSLPLLLAPATTPASTARLAARAALFVGADTGPTHLAAAAGTPTLALFGPTPPSASARRPRAAVAPGIPRGLQSFLAGMAGRDVHEAAASPRVRPRARAPRRPASRPPSAVASSLDGRAAATARKAPRSPRRASRSRRTGSIPCPFGDGRNARLHGRVAEDRGRRDDAQRPRGRPRPTASRSTGSPCRPSSNDYVSKFYPVRDLLRDVGRRARLPAAPLREARARGALRVRRGRGVRPHAPGRKLAGRDGRRFPSGSRTSSRPSTS